MKSERVASSSARCCSPKKGALADYYISKMPFQCPCCDTGSGSTLYNLWRHHDGKHSECPLGCPCHILYPRLPPPPPPMDPKMQQLLQHVLLSSVFFVFFPLFFTPPPECGVGCRAAATFVASGTQRSSCIGGVFCVFRCKSEAASGGRQTSLSVRTKYARH